MIPLADTTLEILRDYWKTHRNPVWMIPSPGRPGREGRTATKPVSVATLYHALKKATTYAGVRKHVTTHTLRHSYATHLLDAGVSVLHVQKYLGHKSLE
ncbi:MAG: hypothetical protein EOL87_14110 [Spartobacteria bacterium]|nr:hypothetical protein [Spartobacteria bacterium]